MKKLKIFIIAGEASGDVLGAKIMQSFKGRAVEFRGIGGADMKSAGLKSIFPMADLSVMGITAVLMRARTLMRRINETADAILKYQPDIVLTIDSPGFAKAVAKKIRKSSPPVEGSAKPGVVFNGKIFHIVAPQVWAWRPGRAKKFAKLFDRLYCFFDFEVPYFTKYGLPTIPVGHPIADGEIKKTKPGEFRKNFHVSRSRKIIAMMPGSRPNEVANMMPLFKGLAEKWGRAGHMIVIPTADTVSRQVKQMASDWKVRPFFISSNHRYVLFRDATIAIAASGTVSAELAISHTPAVVVYKTSWLTYIIFKFVAQVKYISLVNIIPSLAVTPAKAGVHCIKTVGKADPIYPEFIQHAANAKNVSRAANKLLNSKKERSKVISELHAADKIWSRGGLPASDLIRNDILKTIRKTRI